MPPRLREDPVERLERVDRPVGLHAGIERPGAGQPVLQVEQVVGDQRRIA